MTITAYCWRCGIEVPMLDEQEWAEIEPLLRQRIDDIKDYRRSNECTLGQAAENTARKTLRRVRNASFLASSNPTVVIPGHSRHANEPGIHTPSDSFWSENGVRRHRELQQRWWLWIPGSRFARPGMTMERTFCSTQHRLDERAGEFVASDAQLTCPVRRAHVCFCPTLIPSTNTSSSRSTLCCQPVWSCM